MGPVRLFVSSLWAAAGTEKGRENGVISPPASSPAGASGGSRAVPPGRAGGRRPAEKGRSEEKGNQRHSQLGAGRRVCGRSALLGRTGLCRPGHCSVRTAPGCGGASAPRTAPGPSGTGRGRVSVCLSVCVPCVFSTADSAGPRAETGGERCPCLCLCVCVSVCVSVHVSVCMSVSVCMCMFSTAATGAVAVPPRRQRRRPCCSALRLRASRPGAAPPDTGLGSDSQLASSGAPSFQDRTAGKSSCGCAAQSEKREK